MIKKNPLSLPVCSNDMRLTELIEAIKKAFCKVKKKNMYTEFYKITHGEEKVDIERFSFCTIIVELGDTQ